MVSSSTPALHFIFAMNNPESVAQSFLQAYYQAFVTNRAGIANFYVIVKNTF